MKKICTLLLFVSFFVTSNAGKRNENTIQPRLIVGIVVDQMRYDYLYRFYSQYAEDGFKRLMKEGMNYI